MIPIFLRPVFIGEVAAQLSDGFLDHALFARQFEVHDISFGKFEPALYFVSLYKDHLGTGP